MQQLQDTERKLSRDRPPGADIASDHTDYLLALCRDKQGTLLIALDDTVVAGFIVVVTEQADEGDQHLYPDYRQYGLVTDLVVDEEYRGPRHCPDADESGRTVLPLPWAEAASRYCALRQCARPGIL